MLERVSLKQVRFRAPGLVPDARGVALGQRVALLLPSIDRLVGFLRLYAEHSSLDDLLPQLRILRVRTPVSAVELVVMAAAESSYRADRIQKLGRVMGGLCFTGSTKHFVQYRDEASPLGYDVTELHTADADLVFYAGSFTQAYKREGELSLGELVFRVQLERVPGQPDLSEESALYLQIRRGLGQPVLRYLWRSHVACEATLCEPPPGAFDPEMAWWLVRVRELPARMLRLFMSTPGISLHRPVAANVAVEVGYRHPIHLESCSQLFAADQFYLFSGREGRAHVLGGPLEFIAGDRFVKTGWSLAAEAPKEGPLAVVEPPPIAVSIRLEPTASPPRRVTAALVPWEQAGWLKKLVYALPPTLLAGHRMAATSRLLVLVADRSLDVVPLGLPMQQLAQGLYVPVGYELVPRTSPEVVQTQVGAGAERLVFFAPFLPAPLLVENAALHPLERRLLAQIEVEPARSDARAQPPAPRGEPEMVATPLGPFALWGWGDGPPSSSEPST
jgi:hypothetical protein